MKRFLLICSVLGMMLIFMACSNEQQSKGQDTLEEVTVMLDWYPNAIHSFLYVAKEKGYFEEEGLDVDFQFPANTTDPLNLAAANKVDIGIYYQPDVILARANQGIDVKAFASIVHEPLNSLVFLEDTDIERPKDLVGKTVGYPGTEISEAVVKTMIEADGGTFADVNFVDVGFDLGTALISKEADAVGGMFVNHEVPLLQFQGHDVDYFQPTDYGVPAFSEVVAVTSADTWEKKEDDLRKFWAAATKGYEDVVEDPEASLELLFDHQNEDDFPLELEVERESLEILLNKMGEAGEFGQQDRQSWEATAKWLQQAGLMDELPDIDEAFVQIRE